MSIQPWLESLPPSTDQDKTLSEKPHLQFQNGGCHKPDHGSIQHSPPGLAVEAWWGAEKAILIVRKRLYFQYIYNFSYLLTFKPAILRAFNSSFCWRRPLCAALRSALLRVFTGFEYPNRKLVYVTSTSFKRKLWSKTIFLTLGLIMVEYVIELSESVYKWVKKKR